MTDMYLHVQALLLSVVEGSPCLIKVRVPVMPYGELYTYQEFMCLILLKCLSSQLLMSLCLASQISWDI